MLACLGTGLAVGVAGCSGGGEETADPDGGDGSTPTGAGDGGDPATDAPDEDVGDPTATPTDADATPVSGVEGTSTVDGLEVTDVERVDGDDYFTAYVTVRNAGERSTDPYAYGYDVALYDAEGVDIAAGATSKRLNEEEIAPGAQAIATVTASVDGSVDDVAAARVTVNCRPDTGDGGAYCAD
jgi:hypothetical protein